MTTVMVHNKKPGLSSREVVTLSRMFIKLRTPTTELLGDNINQQRLLTTYYEVNGSIPCSC